MAAPVVRGRGPAPLGFAWLANNGVDGRKPDHQEKTDLMPAHREPRVMLREVIRTGSCLYF